MCSNCIKHGIECTYSIDGIQTQESSPSAVADAAPSSSSSKTYRFRPYETPSSLQARQKNKNESCRKAEDDEKRVVSPATATSRTVGVQCNLSTDTGPNTSPDHTGSNSSAAEKEEMVMTLADLELFHHFLLSTSRTIVETPESYPIWQDHVIKWSMSFPSILHLILALSALHLSREKSPEIIRDQYIQKGDDHFTSGVRSVTTLLSQFDVENCQRVYICAILICLVYFARGPCHGEYLVFSNNGPSQWLDLFRGVKLILNEYYHVVFSGVLEPKVHQHPAEAVDVSPQSLHDELEEDLKRVNSLRSLFPKKHSNKLSSSSSSSLSSASSPSPDNDIAIYSEVIDDLLRSYREIYRRRTAKMAAVGCMDILMGWIYRLPDEFIRQLENKEQVALTILAYWTVL